ncbi:MAG: 4Fe-4S dicluster domain-containing protein [Desulfobacterales bacterium]|nr:4Fe-4S dicluster domain-containing protein [Desulfobacterales bacterium]
MGEIIHYHPRAGRRIESESRADIRCCWTCGSCDFECPVNIATGRLRPQKIVRMAALGMLDELLDLPEIWYCLTCRRCAQICPNAVSPAAVIAYIRREMISSCRISWETVQRYQALFLRFQRVRWRAAAAALDGSTVELTETRWRRWMDTPIPPPARRVIFVDVRPALSTFRKPVRETGVLRCFACGECSSACPISCHRNVFDPRALLRMVHLGQPEALFRSPALWLCLECNRCTDACSQKIDGRRMIRFLREMAVQIGAVDPGFFSCLEQSNRVIYTRLLKDIDPILGFCARQEEECHRRAYA